MWSGSAKSSGKEKSGWSSRGVRRKPRYYEILQLCQVAGSKTDLSLKSQPGGPIFIDQVYKCQINALLPNSVKIKIVIECIA